LRNRGKGGYREVDEDNESSLWREMKVGLKSLMCPSKIKPRLQAEWVVLSEELHILTTCFGSDNQEFSLTGVKSYIKFAVIREERC